MEDEFTLLVLERLAPLGPISARRMFGARGLFLGGTMFALIVRDELYFRVGDTNRAEYEAAGAAPFSYATRQGGRHTITAYWSCPPERLEDPDGLCRWGRKAIEAARAAAERRQKPRARPRR